MGGHADRQLGLVEDLAGDEVGQRHLGGRDQPPAVGGLVAVLGELRQLAGAEHRLVADEHRGPDLGQPVPLDVGVEHELGERAVQADHRALHHHEARAGEAAGGLEVEAGLRRRDLEVLERAGGEVARAAPAVDLDVGGLVGAVGDVVAAAGSGGRAADRAARRRRRRPRPRAGRSRPSSRRRARAAARTPASSPRALAAPTSRLAALRSASAASAAAMRARRVSSSARISAAAGGEAAAGEGGVEGVRLHRGSGGCRAWAGPGIVRGGLWPSPARKGSAQSGTASARSLRSAALARSAACSAGSSSGKRSAATPARAITRGDRERDVGGDPGSNGRRGGRATCTRLRRCRDRRGGGARSA